MIINYLKCGSLGCLLLTILCFPVLAQNKGVDLLIFNDAALTTPGIKSKEVQCLVLEDTAESVRVDLSLLSGVAEIRTYPKSLIESVKLADRSPFEFKKIENALQLPEQSQPTSFYDTVVLNTMDPFITKYPGTEAASKVADAKKQFRYEKLMIDKGWVRGGTQWYGPSELEVFQENVALNLFLTELKAVQARVDQGDYEDLTSIEDKVLRYKKNLNFPYLLEGIKVILAPADAVIPLTLKTLLLKQALEFQDAADNFQKSQAAILDMQEKKIIEAKVLVAPLNGLNKAAKIWPELRDLQKFLELNRLYFFKVISMTSLQSINNDQRLFREITASYQNILKSEVYPIEVRVEDQKRLNDLREYQKTMSQLLPAMDYSAMVALAVPIDITAYPETSAIYQKYMDSAQEQMKLASDALEQSKKHYEAGEYEKASEQVIASIKVWPLNVLLTPYKDEILAKGTLLMTAKKKEEATRLLALLVSGWGDDLKVRQFSEQVKHTQTFAGIVDEFSGMMIVWIILGLIAILVVLKVVSKMVTDA